MRNLIVLSVCVLFASCAAQPPAGTPIDAPDAQKPAPIETPEIPSEDSALYTKCSSGVWCYDELVAGRVTNKLIATDPGIYCPKYKTLSKKHEFWSAFAKAVTRGECGWKPGSYMTEKFKDRDGKLVISAGMFQLSTGDARNYAAYPDCKKISEQKYLFDPITNLKCGMGIMDKLAGSRATMQESLGRYWSTIRDNKNATDGLSLVATVKKYYPPCF